MEKTMTHVTSFRLVLLVLTGCGVLAPTARAAEASATVRPRPNILFFLTDDQPQIGLGCLGNPHIRTPNMDALATEGVLFSNAFVTTSICACNRASLLTGQTQRRHGIDDFQKPLSAEAFAQTYPMLLRQAGYRTGYLGKFAIGRPSADIRHLSLPADKFDFWYGFPQSIDFRQTENGRVRYLTTVMAEKATEFLRQNPADRPFCLTVALKEPHGPWNYFDPDVPDVYADITIPPPPTFTQEAFDALPEFIQNSLNGGTGRRWLQDPEQYQKWIRTDYRLITRADMAVGQIMAALRQSGLDQNTVVIFTSDNGEFQGAHGLTGKWLMYEESIRVPLIIRDPRLPKSQRGRRCEAMALSIDLAPTMLSLAGVSIPAAMEGRDLGPLVRGDDVAWRDDWYYEHTYANPPVHRIPKTEGVRTKHWKYTRYTDFTPPYEQLFDLAADPRELKNLAGDAAHAATLAKLRARCDQYREQLP
jgi:arylsulfatase A-like enzyme